MSKKSTITTTQDSKNSYFNVSPVEVGNKSSDLLIDYSFEENNLKFLCQKGCALKLDAQQIKELHDHLTIILLMSETF